MPTIQELFDLSNRAALVTGGAGLLGKQFAKTLAEAGAAVVVADLSEQAAIDYADELTHTGYRAIGLGLDVTQPESAQHAVETAIHAWGRLDIVVNSAALDPKFEPGKAEQHTNAFEDYPLEQWNQAVNVNLTGMFLMCQAAARVMKTQGSGSIINISSTYGLAGPDQRIYEKEGQPPRYKPVYYSVTKAGVLGLTRYVATYYAGTAIRCNALTPGGVYNDHDEQFTKAYAYRTVMGRMAEKHEMNGALLFLASDASSYMTGGNLVVDGGWTAW
jgi:NAD(P)-dependent dehydrogenase (short-subunit alcohol dehydrogenase family)